jgi:hypothetical protein
MPGKYDDIANRLRDHQRQLRGDDDGIVFPAAPPRDVVDLTDAERDLELDDVAEDASEIEVLEARVRRLEGKLLQLTTNLAAVRVEVDRTSARLDFRIKALDDEDVDWAGGESA